MGIDAVNSTSFNPNYSNSNSNKKEKTVVLTEKELTKIDQIKRNIRPLTIIAGAGIIGVSFYKGGKIVPIIRKTAVTAGEYLAKGAAKLASTATNGATKLVNFAGEKIKGAKFNPKNNPLNFKSMKENIEETASKLRDEVKEGDPFIVLNDKNKTKVNFDENFVKKVGKLVKKITNENTSEKVTKFMNDNGIVNKVRAVDTIAATGIGLAASDVTADVIEDTSDEKEINGILKNAYRTANKLIDLGEEIG